jgi:uncharacterized protein
MSEYPSVTVFGPRQCGKTTLARAMYPDFSYANLEDVNIRLLAQNDPEEFFTKYPEPVIIDEIQRVPQLLSTVQVRIDRMQMKGRYLITGSQQIPLKNAVAQSLAGRTAVVQMFPLSLSELEKAGITLDRDTQLVAGCMPFLFKEKGHKPAEYYRSYIDTYIDRDIAGMNAVQDLSRFTRFLTLLAGRAGQLVNNSALAGDVGVSSTTLGSWLSLLESTHLIYTLRPWFTSRTSQVVKTPKIYFCDTGIAASLLGIETPEQMTRDPLMGNLFENLVVTEALKAGLNTGGSDNLYFFRNSSGLEIDLIRQNQNTVRLFEIKSGKSLDENYLRSMRSFRTKYSALVDKTEIDTVIYSGETCPSYLNASFRNFRETGALFEQRGNGFTLSF